LHGQNRRDNRPKKIGKKHAPRPRITDFERELFVLNFLKTQNLTESYLTIRPKLPDSSAHKGASRLMSQPKTKAILENHQQKIRKETELGLEYVKRKIHELIEFNSMIIPTNKGRKMRDANAVSRGLELAGRVSGLFKDGGSAHKGGTILNLIFPEGVGRPEPIDVTQPKKKQITEPV